MLRFFRTRSYTNGNQFVPDFVPKLTIKNNIKYVTTSKALTFENVLASPYQNDILTAPLGAVVLVKVTTNKLLRLL